MRFISQGALPRAASDHLSVAAPVSVIATDTALRTVFGHKPMPNGTALPETYPRDRSSPGIRILFSRQNHWGGPRNLRRGIAPLLKNASTSALPYSTS